MNPQRYRQLKSILAAALELPAEARSAYVEKAAAGDAELRQEVESLLRFELESGDYLEESGLPVGSRRIEEILASGAAPGPEDSAPSALAASLLDRVYETVGLEHTPDLRPASGELGLPDLRKGSERYTTIRVLGRGGMGTVLLSLDRDLRRPVALKTVNEMNAEQAARFVEEAQVMAQLQHPGIVTVHELGTTDSGQLYYTMPVVLGRTLKEVLDDVRAGDPETCKQYTLARLVQVLLRIAQAVHYASEKGVIHRDLKPANVMLGEHGEVQVLDWGLAKIVQPGEVSLVQKRDETVGLILGTPGYMAPEQVLGTQLDCRTDVYALGAMLYEILTLELPFIGDNAMQVAVRTASADLEPPRQRAPTRAIPLPLEAAAIKALAREPAERQATARVFHDEVAGWLEAEADREQRHARAEEHAARGRARLEEYQRLKGELTRLEREAVEFESRYERWLPEEQKTDLFEALDRQELCRKNLVHASSQVVATLTEALGFEDDNSTARGLLADYYWDRFQESEESRDSRTRDFYGDLVGKYHDGKYKRELSGDGSLVLTSEPSGVQVVIHELEEVRCRLLPGPARQLGTTPLQEASLAMGSYLVVLTMDGFREVRYPVHISRNREWRGHVQLFRDDAAGDDFIQVPAGPFIQGGDAECRGWELARSEPVVDDFFIAVHPVTMREYLEFLNASAERDGLAAALSLAPRPSLTAPSYLDDDGARLSLPEVDELGNTWYPTMPVSAISWHDARAYCAWRSDRDGRAYRLPTETEWEKAARGTDGRWYPWGNRFDASLCNMRDSRRDKIGAVPVDRFPSDVSIYGVRGMAGNVRDWTSSEWAIGPGDERTAMVVRGGAWDYDHLLTRCANRYRFDSNYVRDAVGFRLALSPDSDG